MSFNKKILSLTVLILTLVLIFAGCSSDEKSTAQYSFFGKYTVSDVVYSMVNNQGRVGNSYDISGDNFIIYSADKTVGDEIANPKYSEKVITDTTIPLDYEQLDISKYSDKKSYDITAENSDESHYRIYLLDDEIWFCAYNFDEARQQDQMMYIYKLEEYNR